METAASRNRPIQRQREKVLGSADVIDLPRRQVLLSGSIAIIFGAFLRQVERFGSFQFSVFHRESLVSLERRTAQFPLCTREPSLNVLCHAVSGTG